MNTFIFLLGLLLTVVTFIAIIFNKDRKATNIEEVNLTEDTNKFNSQSVENKIKFENVLDKINILATEEISEDIDSISVTNCINKELIREDDNNENNNNNDTQEELINDVQSYRYDRIIELSNSGLSTEDIAKITQKGIREVEIILKFHNNKINSENTV